MSVNGQAFPSQRYLLPAMTTPMPKHRSAAAKDDDTPQTKSAIRAEVKILRYRAKSAANAAKSKQEGAEIRRTKLIEIEHEAQSLLEESKQLYIRAAELENKLISIDKETEAHLQYTSELWTRMWHLGTNGSDMTSCVQEMESRIQKIQAHISDHGITPEIRSRCQQERSACDKSRALLTPSAGMMAASADAQLQTGPGVYAEPVVGAEQHNAQQMMSLELHDQAERQLLAELQICWEEPSLTEGKRVLPVQVNADKQLELHGLLFECKRMRQSLHNVLRRKERDDEGYWSLPGFARSIRTNLSQAHIEHELRQEFRLELQATEAFLDEIEDAWRVRVRNKYKPPGKKQQTSEAPKTLGQARRQELAGDIARLFDTVYGKWNMRRKEGAVGAGATASHVLQIEDLDQEGGETRTDSVFRATHNARTTKSDNTRDYIPTRYEFYFGLKWTLESAKAVRCDLQQEMEDAPMDPHVATHVAVMRRKAAILRCFDSAAQNAKYKFEFEAEVNALREALLVAETLVDPQYIQNAEQLLAETDCMNKKYSGWTLVEAGQANSEPLGKHRRLEDTKESGNGDAADSDDRRETKHCRIGPECYQPLHLGQSVVDISSDEEGSEADLKDCHPVSTPPSDMSNVMARVDPFGPRHGQKSSGFGVRVGDGDHVFQRRRRPPKRESQKLRRKQRKQLSRSRKYGDGGM